MDVAPWLARATVERGDVTNVGVGGNDGVVQMLRFDLHNDGTMMPTWKDTVSKDSSYIVGEENDVVGDESESASKLIDLLLGTKMEYRRDSFSPHDKNSAWNRDENNQYAPLLWSYREVVLAVAITPKGEEPTLNDWMFPFEGFLGENIGVRQNGSIVSVQAKSKAKLLQDTLIETEQEYGSNDEDVSVESVMQDIIDNNLGPGVVSLYCPVPSQSYVRPYVVKDKTVWDALQELAGKLGWFLGDRWDPQTKQHRLTFMEPPIDKNASTADFRFSWTSDFYIQELDQTDRHYRNAIIVEYWDEELEKENTVEVSQELDPGMVRRAAKFGLGKTELIRTETEAIRFATAAFHDLSDDTTLSRVTMPLFPQIDTFHGVVINNPRVASEDLFFGVDTVRHTLDFVSERFTTEFVGSGKVVGGREKWKRMQTRPGLHEPTKPEDIGGGGIALPAPKNVNVRSVMGGVEINVPPPPTYSWRWSHTEIYLSENPGFTPSPSTLVSSGRNTTFSRGDMAGGITVYVRAAYVDADGKRGPYSVEVQGETGKVEETPDETPPAKPTGLMAVPVLKGFVLIWDRYQGPPPLDRYELEYDAREPGGSWLDDWKIASSEIRSATYSHEGLDFTKEYRYRLRVVSRAGKTSEWSDVVQAGQPKKLSLSEETVGELLGTRVEEGTLPVDAFDDPLQILRAKWDDAGEFVEALAVKAVTPEEISSTVGQVYPDGIQEKSTIQQLSDQIALRVEGVKRENIVQARFGEMPMVDGDTLKTGLALDNEPVDFTDLLDGVDTSFVDVTKVRHLPTAIDWSTDSIDTDLEIVDIAYHDGLWVAVGWDADEGKSVVITSPDLNTWTVRLSPNSEEYLHCVTHGPAGWVALVYQAAEELVKVYVSADGLTWSGDEKGALWKRYVGVAASSTHYVAVGYEDGSGAGSIIVSTDADTWTEATIPTTVRLRSVVHGPEGWVVVGDDGTILTSSDLSSWSAVTPVVSDELMAVTYGGGLYVAVGTGGAILTSEDGDIWTQRASGSEDDLFDVVYGNIGFVAVGDVTLSSLDGASWRVEETDAIPTMICAAFGGNDPGTYVAAGGSDGELLIGDVVTEPVEETITVGRVVSYTEDTLTLDTPWTEETMPEDLATDHYTLWHYTPVTAAQILVAQVDGDGIVLIDGTTVVGRLIVRDDLIIQNEEGTFIFDSQGLHQIGPDGFTSWSTDGMIFSNPLGETLGYVRGVKHGIANDGDYVELPFTNTPFVILQPYDMMTYDPTPPNNAERQRIVLQPYDVSPGGFFVYAKTLAESGTDEETAFTKDVSYHPGFGGYCHGSSDHRSSVSKSWSAEAIYSVDAYRTYTTVRDDVSKITVFLTQMLHVHAFAGHYPAQNRIDYLVRARPVGTTEWTKTVGPISRYIFEVGNLFTPRFKGQHIETSIVLDNLPQDQYEIQVMVTGKKIDTSNGYNSNNMCWILVDGWVESSAIEIEPTYPAKVQWLALESNIPGKTPEEPEESSE